MIPEKPATCKKCGDAISTDIVQALFSDWHQRCFRCTSCGQRLNNWYFQNEGNLYCRRHYWSKFGDRCNACSYITSGPVMAIGEHKYHPECFVCCECQTLIDDDDYALLERSFLYCGRCYRAGPGRSIPPHQEVTAPQTPPHTQIPRRKPHSIHMVEIPPTPERQSQVKQQQHQQHHSLQDGQREHSEQQEEEASPKSSRLQLSLQPVSADVSTAGWRGSVNYRHSFTLEGGRLTPCVQISELEPSPELHGLTVGDKILEVNGAAVRDKTLDEIKSLLTNPARTVHVMVERDLSPLRLSPEEDSIAAAAAAASSASPARKFPSRNASSDDLSSPSVSEGETVVVLDQTVRLRPKGSLRARGHSPTRRRSKSPSPCPSVKQKSIDLSRSHSFSTRQDHRAFRPADLIIGEVLGQGFFGQALKATHRVTGEHMVLKELHNFDEAAQKSFLTEVSMLRNLSHPCVLKFLGAFYRDRKLNLVTEFINGGTLSDLLLDHTVELSWKQRIGFAKDIASGMSYLHSMNVIHRDLNSQNCLVRKDQTVVVADFGLAKIVQRHDVSQFSTISEKEKEGLSAGGSSSSAGGRKKKRFSRRKRGTVVGNPYWMAPEMMTKGVYDEKVDVFSFGIIVCETIARVSADPDYLPRSFDFGLNVEAFHSKFCQDGAPEPFFMLAVLCSQIEPDQRPNFDKVHLLCEMLILHVEHGKVIPPELQGSTVEVYHTQKESMYGQNYRNVDSSTQVTNTVADTNGDSVSPATPGDNVSAAGPGDSVSPARPGDNVSPARLGDSVSPATPGDNVSPARSGDSSRNGDSEQGFSHIPANEGQGYKTCLSSDVEINIQDTTMALSTLNLIPDNDEKSKIDSEKLQDTDGYMHLSDRADAVDSQSSLSNTCKSNFRRSSVNGVSQAENGNNEPQELRVMVDDGVGDASVATTNEDYAYFSCSTESPSASFSSPCLSVEDFVSCKSSPASSGSNISDKVPASDFTNRDCGCNGSSEMHKCDESSSSDLQEGTSSQTRSCSINDKPCPSDLDPTEATPKHSRDSPPKLSPSREYQTNFSLEYGASLSSPTHSYILKQQATAGSSECDA